MPIKRKNLCYEEWIIRVVFKDEPSATYFYNYDPAEGITQGGRSGVNGGNYQHEEDETIKED